MQHCFWKTGPGEVANGFNIERVFSPLQNTPQSSNCILKDASHLDPNDPAKLSWDRVSLKKEPMERNAFTFWVYDKLYVPCFDRVLMVLHSFFSVSASHHVDYCHWIGVKIVGENTMIQKHVDYSWKLFMVWSQWTRSTTDKRTFTWVFLYHEYYFFHICMDITTLHSGHGSCTYFGSRRPFKPLRIYQRERPGP